MGPGEWPRIPRFDVVTGAAGFIGSHLVERLLGRGDEVLGVDSFDDYYERPTKEANLATARKKDHFTFLERDLVEFDLSQSLPAGCTVFHLAAQPGVRGSWGPEFDRYTRNNVLLTQRVLEAAHRAGVRRVIYGGSSSIYGAQPPGPMAESVLPNPLSPYGVTKLAGEHLCRLYELAYGLPATVLRFFTVYGERQRPDMGFHRFIRALLDNRPIAIFGKGDQRRDFTYVADIVDGIVAASDREVAGRIFNLGGGSPVGLLEAIRTLEEVSGRPVAVQHESAAVGDPSATWADIRAAQSALDFRPNVRLEEGLRRQWEWQIAARSR